MPNVDNVGVFEAKFSRSYFRFHELNFEDLLDYLYTIMRSHFEAAVKFMKTTKFTVFKKFLL